MLSVCDTEAAACPLRLGIGLPQWAIYESSVSMFVPAQGTGEPFVDCPPGGQRDGSPDISSRYRKRRDSPRRSLHLCAGAVRSSRMKRKLDRDLIVPIRDAASAILMQTKAECLHKAGVINEQERTWVYSKPEGWLSPLEQAA